jgi:hypothetical protein
MTVFTKENHRKNKNAGKCYKLVKGILRKWEMLKEKILGMCKSETFNI